MPRGLPEPSGEYDVGCVDILPQRGPEIVLFRLFYPCVRQSSSDDKFPLWLNDDHYMKGYTRLLSNIFLRRTFKHLMRNKKIPVYWEEKLFVGKTEKFPVVVFSHGAWGNMSSNSFMCYEIASHGFIVAAVEHKDLSASATYFIDKTGPMVKRWIFMLDTAGHEDTNPFFRNMQVKKRANECSRCLTHLENLNNGTLANSVSNFDLKHFTGRLDLSKVAFVGHSLGATTAAEIIAREPQRFHVGALLDVRLRHEAIHLSGFYRNLFTCPMLLIHSSQPEHETSDCVRDMRFSHKKEFRFLGVTHTTFTDFPLLLPRMIARYFDVVGDTNPVVANQAAMEAVLRFVGEKFDLPFAGDVDTLLKKYKFITREEETMEEERHNSSSDATAALI